MKSSWYKITGEDPQIIALLGTKQTNVFKSIVITTILIYILSLFSFFTLFNIIFNSSLLAIFLSIFLTLLFLNIYKLCLATLNANKEKYTLGYIVALAIRLLFITLLGLVISKGFELLFWNIITESNFNTSPNGKIIEILSQMHYKHSITWLITISIISFIITPFLLKFSLSPQSLYTTTKNNISKNIILKEYHKFKITYSLIFKKNYNLHIKIKENYLDPPFNTTPIISKKVYGTNEDFLKHISSEKKD